MMFLRMASWTVLLTVTALLAEPRALSTVLLLTPDIPLRDLKDSLSLGVGVLLLLLLDLLSRLELLLLLFLTSLLLDLDLRLYLGLLLLFLLPELLLLDRLD